MHTSTLAVAGLAVATLAQNTAPNFPIQAQVGEFQFGLTCNIPNYGNKTLFSRFSATAPIQGYSGQQVYFSDLVAEVTLPLSVVGIAKSIGGAKADANVTVGLNVDNATPAQLNPFPTGLIVRNISVTGETPLTVRVPVSGTLSPIGPLTLGSSGQAMSMHLGLINMLVNVTQASNGNPILTNWNIVCPPPNITYALGVTNILPAKAGAAAFKPSNGGSNSFPAIGNYTETGSFRFPYSCAFNGSGSNGVDLTVSGAVPTYLNSGKQFSINSSYAYLHVPAAVANNLRSNVPSAVTARTTVNNYAISVSNGAPTSLNAVGANGITTDTTLPPANNDIGLAVPSNSQLTIGPITPYANGYNLYLTSGSANGTLAFLDKGGKQLSSTSFSCAPVGDSRLIGIPVTDLTPPAIDP